MSKPTYDELVFLIAFLWNWADRFPDITTALADEDARERVINENRPWIRREQIERASIIFALAKDDIEKINLADLEER